MGRKAVDLTGLKTGRLTVIKYFGKDKYSHRLWECLCECGNTTIVCAGDLKGHKQSCGCLDRDRKTTHGMHKSRIYQIWTDMKSRIDNETHKHYSYYGGRGITYCERWKTFEGFYEDMCEGYLDNLTLDRIDSDGNYCKENCRWATHTTQQHNQRKKKGCSSQYRGVSLNKRGLWESSIRLDKKRTHLGRFILEYGAALAYDNASELYYGDRPNKTVREE